MKIVLISPSIGHGNITLLAMTSKSSLLQSFPTEIFEEIFLLTDPVICGWQWEGFVCQSLTLSAVCSRWRQICHASPTLWSRYNLKIHGECDMHDEEYHDHPYIDNSVFIPALDWCFRLSEGQPISVDISIDSRVNLGDPLLSLVFKHSEQFRQLRLVFTPFRHAFSPSILAALIGDLALLQDLEMEGWPHCPNGTLTRASNLRSVKCWDTHHLRHIPRQNVMRAHISLGIDQTLTPIQILAQMPCLKEVTFDYLSEFRDIGLPSNAVRLSACQSLIIENATGSESLKDALKVLSVPQLSTLELEDVDSIEMFPVNLMSSFLDRSQCRLNRFSFKFSRGDIKSVLEVIAKIPSLTELILEASDDISNISTKRILKALREDGILPNIERLSLSLGCATILDQFISETIAYRARGKLDSFSLFMYDRDFDPDAYASLAIGDVKESLSVKVEARYPGNRFEINKGIARVYQNSS